MANPNQGLRSRGPLGKGFTHPLDGRWNAKCEIIDDTLMSNSSSRTRPSYAPKTTDLTAIWFGWANGRPALYEYEAQYGWFGRKYDKPYVRKYDLTFQPKDKKRTWYQEGDLILPDTLLKKELHKRYPELVPPGGKKEASIFDIAMELILGPTEYNIVHRITKLTISAPGEGKIELTPILVLDEKTFVELDKTVVRKHQDFCLWFSIKRSIGPLLRFMKIYVSALYEVMLAVGTGGVGTVGRTAGRRVLFLTLKAARKSFATRILARKIVASLAKNSTKATLAGARSFATSFARVYAERTNQQQYAQQTAAGKNIDRNAFDAALKIAAGDFVASFVSALLGSAVEKVTKQSGYSKVHQAISKRIIDAFGTNIPAVFIKGIASAWVAETQHPGTFASSLAKSLATGLMSSFTSLVSVDFKAIGEQLMSD